MRRSRQGGDGHRPDDFAAQIIDERLRDLGHPGLVVEAVAQAAHQNRQPVAVIRRIAKHESGIAQRFQDSIHGGARQADFLRDFRNRRAVAQIQNSQRIEAAHERTDWAC